MRLKNGVWIHQLELEAFRRLLRTCQDAVDARTPGTADWVAVREAVYDVKNVWLDIEDEDRAIRDLLAIEEDLSDGGGSTDLPAFEGSETPWAEAPPAFFDSVVDKSDQSL